MSLKYAQGFETILDDSDIRTQGWIQSPVLRRNTTVPSATTVPGRSLALMGTAGTAGTAVIGQSGTADPGFVNLGVTVNQAWTAGGFTFGIAGKFNSGALAVIGAGNSGTNNGAVTFDGTLYWAVRYTGTYSICTSPDLITWTATASQPPFALHANTTITYIGNGIVAVVGCAFISGGSMSIFYSSNAGASWTTITPDSGASNTLFGRAFPTGNATYPHGLILSSSNKGQLWIGTLGGTLSSIASGLTMGSNNQAATLRTFNGLLVQAVLNASSLCQIFSAPSSSSTLNTAAAWTISTSSANIGIPQDITYIASSNFWVIATSTGIWTTPASGSTSAPTFAAGTFTATQRYSAGGISSVWQIGSTLVALGALGAVLTSTDGLTWTSVGTRIISATSGNSWNAALYDGTRYIAFSDGTNGVVATSSDLQTGFFPTYVAENAESAGSAYVGTGVWAATTIPTNGGTWTTAGSLAMFAAAPSGGNRTVTLGNFAVGNIATASVASDNNTHYYEITATKDPANTNKFFVSWSIDNVQVFSSGSTSYLLGSSASDTTSVLVTNLSRTLQWTRFDDMYFTLNDGVANTLQGPLGAINIVALRPSTDTQAQWTKSGSAASNALTVRATALSSATGSVTTSVDGAKDLYATADTVPANYRVRAAYVEGYFARTSTTNPTVSVGIQSGSSEVDSATTSIPSTNYTYLSQIVERDPNGNVSWTPTSIQSAKIAITKVS
jgi:hypothetical protein